MQTPESNKIDIEDYYHMTTLYGKVNLDETNTSIVSFSSKPHAPFYTSTCTSTFIIAFLDINTLEKKNLSLIYILCTC